MSAAGPSDSSSSSFERRKKNADVREFFAPRARVEAQGPSGAGAAAPCASTSLQPDDVTQANRLLNELQDAKIIRRVKRTPGTFEHVLLAGQLVASTPIGANGEMQYSTAMKRWGIAQKERYDVRSWAQRFKQLFVRAEEEERGRA